MVSELLKKAEILTERDAAGRAVTFNNFACFTRQQGRLHAALSYLQKALAIEQKLKHVDNPADTHLNLCAVLSQMGRHEEALTHAQSALGLLQDELFGGPQGAAAAAAKPDRIAVLSIAYHNLGVEHEFLKQFTASLQAYTKGVEIASVYLGPAHNITGTLRNSQLAAARAIEQAKQAKEAKEKAKADAAARGAVMRGR
jgi:tetratricopeptide (TPR) repeat protein